MSFDIFKQEKQTLAQATAACDTQEQGGLPQTAAFRAIIDDYKRLFKQTKRLVRIADRNEAELNRLTKSLESQADDLRMARDAAESATRAKDMFLATMSHEIRTPMNGVVGMVDVLRQTPMDPDQRRMLETVNDSAGALLTIINDILDFSKIESGKLDIEQTPVSIRDLAEGVAEMLAPNIVSKNLVFDFLIDPNIPARVMADPVRLRQILFNLIGNAVKFTESTDEKVGIVGLHVVCVKKTATIVELRFDVHDTGIGMGEEAVSRLFQPFTQADASTTRKYGGTGLGLSICKRLVDLMDGEITIASTPGKGSCFSTRLNFAIDATTVHETGEADLAKVDAILIGGKGPVRTNIATYLAAWCSTFRQFEVDPEIEGMIIGVGKNFDPQWAGELVDELETANAKLVVAWAGEHAELISRHVPENPLCRSVLARALGVAAGLIDESDTIQIAKAVARRTPPTIEDARASGQLILIAEDNPINRDVIARQLNYLGYACEMANDGVEALSMLKGNNYGLLLTDCQMPNMDGYDLAGAIRKTEQIGERRLPIIAVTANALQGDGDKCLAAGMDGYLTKPIEMEPLLRSLNTWLPEHSSTAHDLPRDEPSKGADKNRNTDQNAPNGPLDLSYLKKNFGDDMEMIVDILKAFVEPAEEILDEFRHAADQKDIALAQHVAHKFKSAARTVGATDLADTCLTVEMAGSNNSHGPLEETCALLCKQAAEVITHIKKL